jgi:radical SAM protein (TIGR01212 family)
LKEILTFGRYLKDRFGTKVSKVPISIEGFTCPNIDGKKARGGCSYCQNESFSPNMSSAEKSFKLDDSSPNHFLDYQLKILESEYKSYSKFLKKDRGSKKFLAYFQSFSNTYAPLSTLEALYAKALDFKDCVGLSIGTRADCVDDMKLDYLQGLSQSSEIWIEYGVQSVHDITLEKINRAEKIADIKDTIKKSKQRGLKVCVHLIYGLPGESDEMMMQSAKEVYELGIDSIKFHPLYVVNNTKLSKEYKNGEFETISKERYMELIVKSLEMLPESISVQRVSAGVDQDMLISPQWCRNKNIFMGELRQILLKNGIIY